jgi:hypothetical protein
MKSVNIITDKQKEFQRQYRLKNKHKRYISHKLWVSRNRDKVIAYQIKRWSKVDKEARNAKRRTPEERAKARAYYQKQKLKPEYVIKRRLQSRLHGLLKYLGVKKYKSTFELVGLSTLELKNYIETKFLPGMSWENRDKWHIDHIIPCSAFDLTNPEQQKSCFHYTNLQPMWWRENIIKSNKL